MILLETTAPMMKRMMATLTIMRIEALFSQ
jgi:hypothetical protein